jgi:hypothetical protein
MSRGHSPYCRAVSRCVCLGCGGGMLSNRWQYCWCSLLELRAALVAAGNRVGQHSAQDALFVDFGNCSDCVSCRRVPRCLVVQLADLPLSTGVGGFLLARAACEMLCEAMAAAWTAGRAAPVRRLMLLPQGGNSARVVSASYVHAAPV